MQEITSQLSLEYQSLINKIKSDFLSQRELLRRKHLQSHRSTKLVPLIFGESVFERRFFGLTKESDIQLQFEEHPSFTEDAFINQTVHINAKYHMSCMVRSQ